MSDSELHFRLVDYRKVHPDARGQNPHYLVYLEELWCGSIYLWPGTAEVQWRWIVNGCVFVQKEDESTGLMHIGKDGMEPTREAAMKAWRKAWDKMSPDLDAMRVDRGEIRKRRRFDQYAEWRRVVKQDRDRFLGKQE